MLYIITNIYMYNFNKISIFSVCSINVQIYSSCGEGGGDNIQIYFKFNKIYTTLSESPAPSRPLCWISAYS